MESASELERLFKRLAEEKESSETPRLLEQAIAQLQKLSSMEIPGQVPTALIDSLAQDDDPLYSHLSHLTHLSMKRQARGDQINSLFPG